MRFRIAVMKEYDGWRAWRHRYRLNRLFDRNKSGGSVYKIWRAFLNPQMPLGMKTGSLVIPSSEFISNSFRLPMAELVCQPFVAKSMKRRESSLIGFLSDNVNELLQLAFYSASSSIMLSSQQILLKGNPSITSAVCDSNFCSQFAAKFFEAPEQFSPMVVGFFTSLVEVCVAMFPESIQAFSFFPKFIEITEDYCVMQMMERIFSNDPSMLSIYLYLEDSGFLQKLLDSMTSDRSNEQMFHIGTLCLKVPCMRAVLQGPQFLGKIALMVPRKEAWDFLFHLCSDTTISALEVFAGPALTAAGARHEGYLQYQVSACNFLAKIIELRPETCASIDSSTLFGVFASVFTAFPDHSIALRAVSSLVIASMKQFQTSVESVLIPFILSKANGGQSRTQSAFLMEISLEIVKLCQKDTDLMGRVEKNYEFRDLCNKELGRSDGLVKCSEDASPLGQPEEIIGELGVPLWCETY